jgi:hypothetical protein
LTIIAIGLLIGIPAAVKVIVPVAGAVADAVDSPSVATPGEAHLSLKKGRYIIYERTGTRHGVGGVSFTNDGPITLNNEDATVTSPDGTRLPTYSLEGNETLTKGATIYSSAIGFTTPAAGRYDIRITQAGSGEVAVGRSAFGGLARVGRWFLLGLLAGLVLLLGFILLIVGSVRRGRVPAAAVSAPPAAWATSATGASPPAPNWYPDPDGISRLRYWDGARWTDDRA